MDSVFGSTSTSYSDQSSEASSSSDSSTTSWQGMKLTARSQSREITSASTGEPKSQALMAGIRQHQISEPAVAAPKKLPDPTCHSAPLLLPAEQDTQGSIAPEDSPLRRIQNGKSCPDWLKGVEISDKRLFSNTEEMLEYLYDNILSENEQKIVFEFETQKVAGSKNQLTDPEDPEQLRAYAFYLMRNELYRPKHKSETGSVFAAASSILKQACKGKPIADRVSAPFVRSLFLNSSTELLAATSFIKRNIREELAIRSCDETLPLEKRNNARYCLVRSYDHLSAREAALTLNKQYSEVKSPFSQGAFSAVHFEYLREDLHEWHVPEITKMIATQEQLPLNHNRIYLLIDQKHESALPKLIRAKRSNGINDKEIYRQLKGHNIDLPTHEPKDLSAVLDRIQNSYSTPLGEVAPKNLKKLSTSVPEKASSKRQSTSASSSHKRPKPKSAAFVVQIGRHLLEKTQSRGAEVALPGLSGTPSHPVTVPELPGQSAESSAAQGDSPLKHIQQGRDCPDWLKGVELSGRKLFENAKEMMDYLYANVLSHEEQRIVDSMAQQKNEKSRNPLDDPNYSAHPRAYAFYAMNNELERPKPGEESRIFGHGTAMLKRFYEKNGGLKPEQTTVSYVRSLFFTTSKEYFSATSFIARGIRDELARRYCDVDLSMEEKNAARYYLAKSYDHLDAIAAARSLNIHYPNVKTPFRGEKWSLVHIEYLREELNKRHVDEIALMIANSEQPQLNHERMYLLIDQKHHNALPKLIWAKRMQHVDDNQIVKQLKEQNVNLPEAGSGQLSAKLDDILSGSLGIEPKPELQRELPVYRKKPVKRSREESLAETAAPKSKKPRKQAAFLAT